MLVLLAVLVSVRKKDWSRLQRIVFPVFVLYLCAVLGITVFNRLPFDKVKYNFELFWSYRKAADSRKLFWEIILNYFLLLPFGLMAPLYMKRRWVILAGFLFSAAIELAQYLMRRGLFEFDDIIGNTLGVIVGVIVFTAAKYIIDKGGKKR